MNIPSDPAMLLSWLNMKLRDEYSSLSELCASLDLDEADITAKMKAAGFEYDPAQNRFW